jgi:hypothetical protein
MNPAQLRVHIEAYLNLRSSMGSCQPGSTPFTTLPRDGHSELPELRRWRSAVLPTTIELTEFLNPFR